MQRRKTIFRSTLAKECAQVKDVLFLDVLVVLRFGVWKPVKPPPEAGFRSRLFTETLPILGERGREPVLAGEAGESSDGNFFW